MPTALSELMEEQYRQYRTVMEEWERRRKEHMIFMNQWVHQMKTPLSVIEMITQEDDNDAFKSLSEESDRIRRGLEMVLYMSRLETFEQDFSVEPVKLHEAAVEAVHENKRYFIHSHVSGGPDRFGSHRSDGCQMAPVHHAAAAVQRH